MGPTAPPTQWLPLPLVISISLDARRAECLRNRWHTTISLCPRRDNVPQTPLLEILTPETQTLTTPTQGTPTPATPTLGTLHPLHHLQESVAAGVNGLNAISPKTVKSIEQEAVTTHLASLAPQPVQTVAPFSRMLLAKMLRFAVQKMEPSNPISMEILMMRMLTKHLRSGLSSSTA